MKFFLILILMLSAMPYGWSEPPPLSLGLANAIKTALDKSPDLKSAEARLQIAHGIEKETESQSGLQVMAYGIALSNSTSTMIPTVSGYEPSAMFMVPNGVSSGGGVVASLPLFTGGRVSGMVEGAAHHREAEQLRFQEAKVQLAYAVKIAYYKALVAQEGVNVEERVAQENSDAAGRIQEFLEAGKVAPVELYRAEAELSEAKSQLIQAKNDFTLRKIDLLRILGIDLDTPILLTDQFAESAGYILPQAHDFPDKEALMREAEANRPALSAKRKEVESAEAGLHSAKGDSLPQFYFYGRADSLSRSPGQFNGTSAGIIASLPIFDSGNREGKVEQAEGKLREARSDEEALVLDIHREVTQGWLNLQTAGTLLTQARDELKSAEENLRIARLRVESGKSIQLELLDALSVYERARLRNLDARFAYQAALAFLDRAVGKVSVPSR